MKQAIIIGENESIYDIIKQLLISNIYKLNYILLKKNYYLKEQSFFQVHFELISKTDVIFISEDLDGLMKAEIFDYANLNNKEIIVLPSIFAIARSKKSSHYNDLFLYRVNKLTLTLTNKIIKRVFDFIISLLLIILLSPVMILIVIIIRIFDNGPVLYRQRRLTLNKKSYVIYKFRTMIDNAEVETGAVLSSDKDERITKVGGFLRKTRLDELPQLFNVLIGDMSLVGPRPERNYYIEQFESENRYYKYRFNTLAGITGLAQINAHYDSSYTVKLKHDLDYIAHYSIFNDMIIILKTIKFFFYKKPLLLTNSLSFEEVLDKYNLKLIELDNGVIEVRKLENEKEKNYY